MTEYNDSGAIKQIKRGSGSLWLKILNQYFHVISSRWRVGGDLRHIQENQK